MATAHQADPSWSLDARAHHDGYPDRSDRDRRSAGRRDASRCHGMRYKMADSRKGHDDKDCRSHERCAISAEGVRARRAGRNTDAHHQCTTTRDRKAST